MFSISLPLVEYSVRVSLLFPLIVISAPISFRVTTHSIYLKDSGVPKFDVETGSPCETVLLQIIRSITNSNYLPIIFNVHRTVYKVQEPVCSHAAEINTITVYVVSLMVLVVGRTVRATRKRVCCRSC